MITPEAIEQYCINHSKLSDPLFDRLKDATLKFAPHVAHMQVGPLEGSFFELITILTQAETVLEFGTFTGYSSLRFAQALPPQGKVTTLDRDPHATEVAKQFWKEAKLDSKIELILGDAKDTVERLKNEVLNQTRPQYDLAFIDADKAGYPFYFDACLSLVKKSGVIMIDNVLWSGAVLAPQEKSDFQIHEFNEKVKLDSRVESLMLPIRDGITLCRLK